jgi:glycine/D-amino acid oxidase-like deaminating enzyme
VSKAKAPLPELDPSGWYALLRPKVLGPPLTGPRKADFAIVGAGFTGVAAAHALARHFPSANIALLEAQHVGEGSAGRNSGFIVDVGHYNGHLSLDQNRKITLIQRLGGRTLREWRMAFGIECGWHTAGRIHAAASERGTRMLDRYKSQLDAMNEPHTVWDPRQLADVTATDYYATAVYTPGTTLIQPAALIRGLAAALPDSVRLFEHSPVQRIEDRGDGLILKTDHGEVLADRVLLCLNGHAPAFTPGWSRLFPLMTFASLTVPLRDRYPSMRLMKLPPWGLISEDKMGSTVRWTEDGRLLIRNSIAYSPDRDVQEGVRSAILRRHRRALARRYPDIADAPFEFSWGGTVGVTLNAVPQFEAYGKRMWVLGGCNGVGMALGTALGVLISDQLTGKASAELEALQSLPKPSLVPPRPILRLGVPPTLAWMQWRSGRDC